MSWISALRRTISRSPWNWLPFLGISCSSACIWAQGSHDQASAVADLDVHPGLAVQIFASEPMLKNPTAMDIDACGRVWVCEVINYRRFANGDQPERPEGDRILVLEDTDQDGQADKSTTFYQGRDIDSAHGICILADRILVSARDKILAFFDDNGDLHADRKEVLFSGIGGVDHDHGIHTVNVGPDGRLYFNFGNEGHQICDREGAPITDQSGRPVADHGNPYRQGMIFRCHADGSQFETLAWNFRNNWEVAIDSFGSLWQSDNDDDGNKAVRINFILEGGNFGFQDEMTGAGWPSPRTGWESEIPQRHWHQEDPGVVPNVLITGAGSPTGICIYEGTLLPEELQGQPIHCDAGPNVVRCYATEKVGAGYQARSIDLLNGSRNPWFRPTDVCVAPDGSLLISDWYDPGVGGHRMQDTEHGRIFRLAPPQAPYCVPPFDLTTPENAAQALLSPNVATRTRALAALQTMGPLAIPPLQQIWRGATPRARARALWILADLVQAPGDAQALLEQAAKDSDPEIRVCAIRMARWKFPKQLWRIVEDAQLVQDPAPEVRRELLIALAKIPDDVRTQIRFAEIWSQLARQFDGADRWYLEALGIAAASQWDSCLEAWLAHSPIDEESLPYRRIIWRSRGTHSPELLVRIITHPQTTATELPRYFRALDFQKDGDRKQAALHSLLDGLPHHGGEQEQQIAFETLMRFDDSAISTLTSAPGNHPSMDAALAYARRNGQFIGLVVRFKREDCYEDLLKIAQDDPQGQLSVEAITALIDLGQLDRIQSALADLPIASALHTVAALETCGDARLVPLLHTTLTNASLDLEIQRGVVRALAASHAGADQLCSLAEKNALHPALWECCAVALQNAQSPDIQERVATLFPSPRSKDIPALPTLASLTQLAGDSQRGRQLFTTTGTCLTCHQLQGEGVHVGPDLSEIGSKLSPPALFESILYPSAGISHGYESWLISTDTGNVLSGIVVSETASEILLKDAKGILHSIEPKSIEERKKQEVSLMPANLPTLLSQQDLVDLVAYLQTLKQP
jgi:putative membrane-bound dehydrogenase-like protein